MKHTRNTIPEHVQARLEALLAFYLEPTERILQKDKYLIPMAARLDVDGTPALVGLMPGDSADDTASTEVHLQAYRTLLRTEHPKDQAHLLAYDIRLKDNAAFGDAIAVELESAEKHQIRLYVPYRFSGWRKKLSFGEIERIEPSEDHLF